MPSLEGFEVETALRKGWPESSLYVVDYNPAIVATLKRKFPQINTRGVAVDRAASTWARRGVRVARANLDLTGNIGAPLAATLRGFAMSGILGDEARIAVTVLRGRERAVPLVVGGAEEWIERHADQMLEWFATHCTRCGAIRLGRADMLRVAFIAFCLSLGAATPEGGGGYYSPVRCGAYVSGNGQSMLWIVLDRLSVRRADELLDQLYRLGRAGRSDLAKSIQNRLRHVEHTAALLGALGESAHALTFSYAYA